MPSPRQPLPRSDRPLRRPLAAWRDAVQDAASALAGWLGGRRPEPVPVRVAVRTGGRRPGDRRA